MRKHFLLGTDDGVVFLNHGSYGATPREVISEQQRLTAQMEANPDHWFRRGYQPLWHTAMVEVAGLAGADPADCVFVKNATAAVNAVLNTIELGDGDTCLITNQTYQACANAVQSRSERSGASVRTLELQREQLADPDAVVEAFTAELDAAAASGEAGAGRVRFALVDHITSPTAVVLPVQRLCAVCRARGVQVMVDGAHAPGSIVPLDVPALGCDWYTGNLHKWAFCPKGSALLWVAREHQPASQAPIISHEWRSQFQQRFIMQGTLDDTAFAAAPAAFRFAASMGGFAAIAARNHQLVAWAAGMLVERWGTELYAPVELCVGMAVIRTPLDAHCDSDLFTMMWDRFGIIAPVLEMPGAAGVWVRISAQLYNERAEYVKLADCVLELAQELGREPG